MTWLEPYDPHINPHAELSAAQEVGFICWCICLVTWCFQLFGSNSQAIPVDVEANLSTDVRKSASPPANGLTDTNGTPKTTSEDGNGGVVELRTITPSPQARAPLETLVTLGVLMLFFIAADYWKVLPPMGRTYARDTFLFLIGMLFLVAGFFTVAKTTDKILNRDQTEEWKGWMQVMFVWYHYFAGGADWYNWIRVYIAAYVWMTGFGNFSFFWIKNDYSLWRFGKMMFRLNFLVLVVCVSVSNPYMLYYICAMHTYWFLTVYVTMAILPSWNKHRYRMLSKLSIYALANAIIFDLPGVSSAVFRPFWFILGFNMDGVDIMHEWSFRAGLDHWSCFIGMICAYNYPYVESLVQYLESSDRPKLYGIIPAGWLIKTAVGSVLLIVFCCWCGAILPMEKFTYNKYHPYTSFIPVLTFIYFRNISPWLRTRYMNLFAWLGKITLETYISQLHIYLQSNAKSCIGYLPGYPLLNFALATIIYLTIANGLFHITNKLSHYYVPNNRWELVNRWTPILVAIVCACFVSWLSNLVN